MKKILIAAITILLLAVNIAADSTGLISVDDFYEKVNRERVLSGEDTLEIRPELENLARFYSGVCAKNGVIRHDIMTDDELFDIAYYYNVDAYTYLGEVLQSGTIESLTRENRIINNFKRSPSHWRILMHKDGNDIGANYVVVNGEIYFTAYVGRD